MPLRVSAATRWAGLLCFLCHDIYRLLAGSLVLDTSQQLQRLLFLPLTSTPSSPGTASPLPADVPLTETSGWRHQVAFLAHPDIVF